MDGCYGCCNQTHMDVSENSGTPKSSILVGVFHYNHPFWGTTIFGNTHIIMSNSQQTKKNTSCLNHRTKCFFVPGRTYIYKYICTVLSHTFIINRGIQSHKPSTTIISYMYIFRINNLQLYTSIQTRVKSMSAKYTWNTQPFIYSKKHTSFLLFTSFRPACCKK